MKTAEKVLDIKGCVTLIFNKFLIIEAKNGVMGPKCKDSNL